MSIANVLSSFFSAKVQPGMRPQVVFYKEAAEYAEHFRLRVTNRTLKISDVVVPGAFVGMTQPPRLDVETLNYIFETARAQGYVPHHLEAYQLVDVVSPVAPPVVTQENLSGF